MSTRGEDSPAEPPTPARAGEPEGGAPSGLPAEVGKFLRSLGTTLGKFVIYPDGHPSLDPAIARLEEDLEGALSGRKSVSLRVRRDRLLTGDGSTDPDNPLLSGLADRLHRHELEAVVFRDGVAREELHRFLSAAAGEPGRDRRPLGSEEAEDEWDRLELRPRRYDPLRMESGLSEEPSTRSPAGEEEPPVGSQIAGVDILDREPSEVARQIRERLEEEDLDRVMALQLFRLSERLGETGSPEAEQVRERLSRVVLSLPSEVLGMLLRLARDGADDDRFLLAAARSMEVEATLKLVQAAAAEQDDVAEWLLSLILKLSTYGREDRARAPARSEAVHDLVDRILEAWNLEDPRPTVYQSTLHRMSRNPPQDAGVPERRARAIFVSPERVLKMGLELDERVGYVREAADQMIESGRFGGLAELLEAAPGDNNLAEELWERLAVPEIVARLLDAEPPGFPLVERLVDVAGAEVAPPLLDALSSQRSESRIYWRKVFNLLVTIGEPVVPLVPPRLEDDRWYVRRNMLSLIRELPGRPEDFDVLSHMEDPDPRVRGEGLALALEDPAAREPALLASLEDEDTRMVGLALSAAEASCPDSAAGRLAEIATSERHASSHRVRATRLLGRLDAPEALDALLELVWSRRWFFWRRISDPAPLVQEALEALARGWSDSTRAVRALEAARGSDHPEIREAASAEEAS